MSATQFQDHDSFSLSALRQAKILAVEFCRKISARLRVEILENMPLSEDGEAES